MLKARSKSTDALHPDSDTPDQEPAPVLSPLQHAQAELEEAKTHRAALSDRHHQYRREIDEIDKAIAEHPAGVDLPTLEARRASLVTALQTLDGQARQAEAAVIVKGRVVKSLQERVDRLRVEAATLRRK